MFHNRVTELKRRMERSVKDRKQGRERSKGKSEEEAMTETDIRHKSKRSVNVGGGGAIQGLSRFNTFV